MPIITLTTDMGLRDYYVSSIKGAIYSQLPEVNITDITHWIKPWNTIQASFILKNAYHNFPKGTIHIIGVDTELTPKKLHLAILFDGHYFIGADNGIFSLMFNQIVPEKAVVITIAPDPQSITFPTKDVFVKAACHIARGGILEVIGRPFNWEELNKAIIGEPVVDVNTNSIVGKVIYIDNYGNAITNINYQLFKSFGNNREFAFINRPRSYKSQAGEYIFSTVQTSYHEVDDGEITILNNNLGLLEIAINRGNAAGLLDLDEGQQVKFQFGKGIR